MPFLMIRAAVFPLAFLIILLCVAAHRTHGDVESPRVVLGPGAKGLVVGPGMNAAGRDLRGSEFVTQNLTGAVFDGCNLYGVRIDGCILKNASFCGAIFAGAHVEVNPTDERADFTNATINGVSRFWRPAGDGFYLYGMDLTPDQLMTTWSYKNKDLYQCAISASYPYPSREVARFDFRGADLREAALLGDCSKSDFTNAHIFEAYFGNDSITFDQLASTWDFKQRRLRVRLASDGNPVAPSSGKWDFSHVNLEGSDLSFPPTHADFTDATIKNCTFRNGVTRAQLYSTRSYQHGNLTGLRLMNSDLSRCDLSAMNLTGSRFSHCRFARTSFDDAVIADALFVTDKSIPESDRLTIEQIKSTWNYKHGRMAGIRLPDELAAALAEDAER